MHGYDGASGASWCGLALLIALGLALFLWCSSSGAPSAQLGTSCGLFGAARSCGDPQVVSPASKVELSELAAGPTVPLDVARPQVASIGGLNLQGNGSAGTSLQGAWDLTEPGKEYMQAYNPTGLAAVMPAGWKTKKPSCEGSGAGAFAEFSRYSITPEAVAKSENMRSVLRLSENTRQNYGRIVGYTSLLRNSVTPVGPVPIGSDAFIFNGSELRDSYIAAATGKFPDLATC